MLVTTGDCERRGSSDVMRLRDDEAWLRAFTAKYCRKKSISDIGRGDLKKWGALTDKTDGQHLAEHMAPDLWADSVETLKTAYAILGHYAPARINSGEPYQRAMSALGIRVIRETKKRADAQGNGIRLKAQPKNEEL